MNLETRQREAGEVPVGAVVMTPLFLLPLGAWLVEHGWLQFGECGLQMLLGIPCFTCGATRATVALAGGNLLRAISFQPLIIFIYGALAFWGVVSLGSFLIDRRVVLSLSDTEKTVLKIAILAAPVVNWAYLVAAGV